MHDVDFRRGEVCSYCVSEPGDGPEDEAVEVSDAADLRAGMSDLLRLAKSYERRASELLEGTDREVTVSCKAADTAIKCRRLALEVRDRLATQSEIADLIKKYRELLAMDGSH